MRFPVWLHCQYEVDRRKRAKRDFIDCLGISMVKLGVSLAPRSDFRTRNAGCVRKSKRLARVDQTTTKLKTRNSTQGRSVAFSPTMLFWIYLDASQPRTSALPFLSRYVRSVASRPRL